MFNIAHAVRVINSQRVVEADFSEAVDVGDLVRRAVKRDALALEAVWAKQGGAVGTAWGKPEWSEQTQAVWKGASHWSPGVPEILSKAVVPYSMLPIRHLGEAPAPPSPSVSGETHNQQDLEQGLEQEGAS